MLQLPIVKLNVSVTSAPVPNNLQEKGAFISQGGTTGAAGSLTLLTTAADLSGILIGAKTLATLTYSSGTHTVTATVAAGHGFAVGQQELVTVSGCTPTGYNGTFLATIVDATTFTYAMIPTLAAATILGTVTDEDVTELVAMNTTFFAQNGSQAVYVLELGDGDAAHGVTTLSTWLTTYPNEIYSFLVPRYWDTEATFKTLCNLYTAPDKKVNFFVTTTISTYTGWYTGAYNSAIVSVEAPGVPITEFTAAAFFFRTLSRRPNSGSPIMPSAYAEAFGVTAYPTFGNGTLLQTLRSNYINFVITGIEGGIPQNKYWEIGRCASGETFDFWYAVDWAAITMQLYIANTVLNGNNNNIAPLYYEQNGVDTLQSVAVNVLRRGTVYGLLYGDTLSVSLDSQTFAHNISQGVYAGRNVLNAIPVSTYTKDNPSDYAQGLYGGFQARIIPQRGFENIVFNLNATQFTN
ncbi:hypothetical protein UFOVP136_40 [uncultured Caudovirales phage]|uniref:Uncharacterized protein n=1 Tax=uncultured Caudovirales phage TaxID=2100421 RepID=A0A6J5LFS2_9CAUD|nr:hypothetical protein UFOVP136_40 [uncultured Caudovirales phage]